MLLMFFFFQAEDGIRDRSPSRGLGDVYKDRTTRVSNPLLPPSTNKQWRWLRDTVRQAELPRGSKDQSSCPEEARTS